MHAWGTRQMIDTLYVRGQETLRGEAAAPVLAAPCPATSCVRSTTFRPAGETPIDDVSFLSTS